MMLSMLSCISVIASPNELSSRYSLHLLGSNIGEFSVTQTAENGNLIIEAITDVNINFLFSYRVKYVQKTIYNQGTLQSSQVETYKNGKLNSDFLLKLEGNSYLLVSDGDTTIINGLIAYSGSMVYFNEPKGITKIFKERNAETMWISPANEHEYIVKDIKGREINRYYYKNEILEYAEMRHAVGTIELKRITKERNND
ncbi:hypothetical protein K5G00_20620 [Maribellus maritimus]|nr:hypothetical protein [Maribellus maritimus]